MTRHSSRNRQEYICALVLPRIVKKMTRKRNLSPTIAFITLVFLCPLPSSAKSTWRKVQSKNFTLIGSASERDMRQIAKKLEQFREALSIIFPNTKIEMPIPTTVIVFKTDFDLSPFKPRYQGLINEAVRGYFLTGPHMNYIVFGAEGMGQNPYEIIFHEYEHFVTRNNLLHPPLWLDEGLAEFYSTFEISDKDQKATLGAPVSRHVFYLRNHPILSLKTLLNVDRRSPYYNEGSKAGIFYAESWALVHYLMMGNQGKRRSQLAQFISLLDADAPIEESFRRAFQAEYKTIEEELSPYVFRSTYPVLIATFAERLNTEKEIESTELSEAEVQYYLGDLLLNSNRLKDAEAYLQKSIGTDVRFAPSRISLGVLRLRQDRTDEAMTILRSAIEIDPRNYLAHFYYAEALAREKQYDEAIKSYKDAILQKPNAALIFLRLGSVYLQAGKEKEALVTFGQGVHVDPRNAYFFRNLGYIYLRRAQGEFAANDAISYLRIKGWRDEQSEYMVLMKYFGLRQTNRPDDASKALDEAATRVDTSVWPYPVIRYLRHELTLERLLELATDNDKLTEAHAYAGLELSLNHERESALEQLRWVKDKGNKNFVEYLLALAEIARIESAAGPD